MLGFCRSSLILSTSYVTVLYCAVQLEDANPALLGLGLVLCSLHCLVLYQKISSYTAGLWHGQALDEGRLLRSPPTVSLGIFRVIASVLLACGLYWRNLSLMAAVAAVVALHGIQLHGAVAGLKKWRQPQIRCHELFAVRPELLAHSNESPKQLSRERVRMLIGARCFMGCLAVCAVSIPGLVALDGLQVRGELVEYSFDRGHLVYPSETQGFHNTVLLDASVDSMVLNVEAGPNTMGLHLKVEHPLLPSGNETFQEFGTNKAGEFQVFLPAGPLYGRIIATAVGRHSNTSYVFHILRSGTAVKVALHGQFDKTVYKDVKSNFSEVRRLQYLAKNPKWYVPDMDRKANSSFQVEFSPVVYAPLLRRRKFADTPVISSNCTRVCDQDRAGFGNMCEVEEVVKLLDGSSHCLSLHGTLRGLTLQQVGSIASESAAMAEWLADVSVSGKSVAYMPWAAKSREKGEMISFTPQNFTSSDPNLRILRANFSLIMLHQNLIGNPFQLLLAPTSDPTDAEATSMPIQIISHAPPIRLKHTENLLPSFEEDGRLEYALCYGQIESIVGEVDDQRFEVKDELRSGAADCKGHSADAKEFTVVRKDAECKDWCALYTPRLHSFDIIVVRSAERCLQDSVAYNDVDVIKRVMSKWLFSGGPAWD